MQEKSRFILSHHSSVANQFLTELRRKGSQEDRLRFRRNLERIGEILAYEISKTFEYREETIETPLREANVLGIQRLPILISILRAGLPLHQGVLNYFDGANSGFVGAFRDHQQRDDDGFDIALKYFAVPEVADKNVLLIDPMLASGQTLVKVCQQLTAQGAPTHLHIVTAIASPEGVAYLGEHLDIPFSLWIGAVDDHLNHQAYIVPGLGDAGDLAFGPKI
jgi:uracil phosphoribosyltransferase